MIEFERTTDYDLVRSVMTHPRLYPHLTDDACPPADRFEPNRHSAIIYVLVREGGAVRGIFMLVPLNGVTLEIHTCLLPPKRQHARGADVVRNLAPWIWKNTDARRVITNIPEYNRLALRLARAAGMEVFGINPGSFMKHGRLWSQIMLGSSRP